MDRDGTINIDSGYVARREDFQLIPGAAEGMKLLQDSGYQLVIVTNQSGIARGYYTQEQFLELCAYMDELLSRYGIRKIPVYYCPHIGEDCGCRKPKTGLFYEAARQLDIDFASSWAIGDKERDLAICRVEPVRGILLAHSPSERYFTCRDLLEAAEWIAQKAERASGKVSNDMRGQLE